MKITSPCTHTAHILTSHHTSGDLSDLACVEGKEKRGEVGVTDLSVLQSIADGVVINSVRREGGVFANNTIIRKVERLVVRHPSREREI